MVVRFSAIRVAPEVLQHAKPISSTWTDSRNVTRNRVMIESSDGRVLAYADQREDSKNDVDIRWDKSGISSVVTSTQGATYIARPYSIAVLNALAKADTFVSMPGVEPAKPLSKPLLPSTQTSPQEVTVQALIPAAGQATRMAPFTGLTGFSKPFAPLVGENSIFQSIVNQLRKKHGIKTVHTNIRPESKDAIRNIGGVNLNVIIEGEPSGSAGGLVKMLRDGTIDKSQDLLVTQGDAVMNLDLSRAINAHAKSGALVTIVMKRVPPEDTHKFGTMETDQFWEDGTSGFLNAFREKQALNHEALASTGIYVISKEIFPLIQQMGEAAFAKGEMLDFANDIFPELMNNHRQTDPATGKEHAPIFGIELDGYWSDVGSPEQYLEAVRDIYAGNVGFELPADKDTYFENGIPYWPGAKALAKKDNPTLTGNVLVTVSPKKVDVNA